MRSSASAAAAVATATGSFSAGRSPTPTSEGQGASREWFEPSAELRAAMQRRLQQERDLQQWQADTIPRIKKVSHEYHSAKNWSRTKEREEAMARWQALQLAMRAEAEEIMYPGVEPGLRDKFLSEYGCTGWTDGSLKTIVRAAPRGIVEIGAGAGRWADAIERAAAKVHGSRWPGVLAFDDHSSLPTPTTKESLVRVVKGDERELLQPGRSRRALLLVYPDRNDMAMNSVRAYLNRGGDTLLYVGEARGGMNATADFFDEVAREFELEAKVPVKPFPGGFEALYVFKRRREGLALGWGVVAGAGAVVVAVAAVGISAACKTK